MEAVLWLRPVTMSSILNKKVKVEAKVKVQKKPETN
jgi:hypothetical protein